MSNLKEILTKINKVREKNDELTLKMLDKRDDDFIKVNYISTGSPYYDYIAKGLNNYSLLTGWEGSGKSSFMLSVLRQYQKDNPDKIVVVFDGEGTVKDTDLERFGIDTNNILLERTKKLEPFLDTCEAVSKADDVGMIMIDSLKSFYSLAVEEKSAEDNTIGIEAKKYNARMPIILSNCYERNINLVCTHQWREDPGKMVGDSRVLSGGKWVRYECSNHFDFSKGELIKSKEGKVIGHKMKLRIKKSKSGAFDPKEVYKTNFYYYDGGFNQTEEYVRVLMLKGIINRSGGWFDFPSKDGEEIKLQGGQKVMEYLKENKEDFEYLKSMI